MPTLHPAEEPLDTKQLLHVLTALKKGDFSVRLPLEWTGVCGKIADSLNDVIELHAKMAQEFVRVSHAVGKEGKITQRVGLGPVGGSWETLVDAVNTLIEDLGRPSNEMARVIGAVAHGDLSPRMALEVDGKPLEGQFLHTARTVNTMVDQLSSFASEVTRVAREVGTAGKLGGQADVKGAAGIWKDLTDSVNQLAANLTTQRRAIAEVATAVAKGDLTRSIRVEASGEMAILKDNINEMIRNLRDTTQKNSEQDWLKTNLTKFTRLLPGQKDLLSVARLILSELAPLVSAQHGIFYLMDHSNGAPRLRLLATYAYKKRKGTASEFALGESLVGQCALEKERILITDVPSDYVQISSGLGHAAPLSIWHGS